MTNRAVTLLTARGFRSPRRRRLPHLACGRRGAYVEVKRDANLWRDRIRAYRIFLDGTEAGRVRRGATCRLAVPPGPHRLRMAIDWGRSREVGFAVQPGETARASAAAPAPCPWRILYDMTIGWSRYVSLRQPLDSLNQRHGRH